MLPLPFKTVKRFFLGCGGGLCQILPKNIKLIRIKIKVLEEVYQNILYSGMSKDSFIVR